MSKSAPERQVKEPEATNIILPDADNKAAFELFLSCQSSVDYTTISQGLPMGGVITRPMRTGYNWLEVKMIAETLELTWNKDLFWSMKIIESEWMAIQADEMKN